MHRMQPIPGLTVVNQWMHLDTSHGIDIPEPQGVYPQSDRSLAMAFDELILMH